MGHGEGERRGVVPGQPGKLIAFLEWSLQWGDHAEFLRARARKGEPTPAWDSRPRLEEGEAVLWEIYCKVAGEGGRVAPSEILAHLDLAGVVERETREFIYEAISGFAVVAATMLREQTRKK